MDPHALLCFSNLKQNYITPERESTHQCITKSSQVSPGACAGASELGLGTFPKDLRVRGQWDVLDWTATHHHTRPRGQHTALSKGWTRVTGMKLIHLARLQVWSLSQCWRAANHSLSSAKFPVMWALLLVGRPQTGWGPREREKDTASRGLVQSLQTGLNEFWPLC